MNKMQLLLFSLCLYSAVLFSMDQKLNDLTMVLNTICPLLTMELNQANLVKVVNDFSNKVNNLPITQLLTELRQASSAEKQEKAQKVWGEIDKLINEISLLGIFFTYFNNTSQFAQERNKVKESIKTMKEKVLAPMKAEFEKLEKTGVETTIKLEENIKTIPFSFEGNAVSVIDDLDEFLTYLELLIENPTALSVKVQEEEKKYKKELDDSKTKIKPLLATNDPVDILEALSYGVAFVEEIKENQSYITFAFLPDKNAKQVQELYNNLDQLASDLTNAAKSVDKNSWETFLNTIQDPKVKEILNDLRDGKILTRVQPLLEVFQNVQKIFQTKTIILCG